MRLRWALAALLGLMMLSPGALAEGESHRGVLLLSRVNAPVAKGVVSPEVAEGKIRRALDLIYRKSPLAGRMIDSLKEAGTVVIIYDPDHARSSLVENRLAMFETSSGVEEIDRDMPLKFVAVLGRQVLHRNSGEIAGTIVHEIVGHGSQHRAGRLSKMTVDDRECEARLFQLATWQDLGVPQRAPFVVQFRRSLERLYCLPFRQWLVRRNHHMKNGFDLIEIQPIDLAVAFRDYIDQVLGKGMPTSADE
jgi:hypothetical protein